MADDGRERVRERVQDEMTRRSWSNADLARAASVDAGTVGDFLAGTRWPKGVTRGKIAGALGWTPESLDRLERGEEPRSAESVSDQPQDAGVLLNLPPGAFDGLSLADQEEALAAAKAALLERAREIRRRLDS